MMEVKYPYVVQVSLGRTVNTGNYESLRVNISLSAPIKEFKNVEKTVKILSQKIEKMLDEEIGRLEDKYGNTSKGKKFREIDLLELEEE